MDFSPESCSLCPRSCHADRTLSSGFCAAPDCAVVHSAMLHRFEEPCISGTNPNRGAGTVFFVGCTLRCVYCQNKEISRGTDGRRLTSGELAELFLDLQSKGAYNIDLVSPTPYIPYIVDALDILGDSLEIPTAWNTSGYEKADTVEMLRGYAPIWLCDMKYASSDLAKEYSMAENYPDMSFSALHKMVEIAGKPKYYKLDGEALLSGGVIVRHLCLPGHRKDTEAFLRRLRDEFSPDEVILSLMSQYTPGFAPEKYKNLSRRITTFEYDFALNLADELGFDGFSQEKASALKGYTPDFSGNGENGSFFQ